MIGYDSVWMCMQEMYSIQWYSNYNCATVQLIPDGYFVRGLDGLEHGTNTHCSVRRQQLVHLGWRMKTLEVSTWHGMWATASFDEKYGSIFFWNILPDWCEQKVTRHHKGFFVSIQFGLDPVLERFGAECQGKLKNLLISAPYMQDSWKNRTRCP
jgi:hypothetical protein